MRKWIAAVVLSVLFVLPCSAGDIVVGSFNIEWFGHGNHPRDGEQIALLANYIKSLEVDVLACQEINPNGDKSENGISDWRDLTEALGEHYEAWYGSTGSSQRLAFIWRTDRVQLSDVGELKDVEREEVSGTNSRTFPRRPLTAFVKSLDGGVDFRIVTVHLYWSVDKCRYQEAAQLNRWAKDYLASNEDDDLLIIGDCNTKPLGADETGKSKTIKNLVADDVLECISIDRDEWTTPESEERYDHAFLSGHLGETTYIEDSWDVRREVVEAYPYQYKRDISNHVPVSLRLADEDNDSQEPGDWGEGGPED